MDTRQDITTLINQFDANPENRVLREKYLSETFFDVVGKAHSETVHSNFLRWFFRQYPWNALAIKKLIEVSKKRAESSGVFPKKLEDLDFLNKCEVFRVDVSREIPCVVRTKKGKQKGRVDIVISCDLKLEESIIPLKIIIENKLDSAIHDHQTHVYYTYFSNKDSECSDHGEKFSAYTKEPKYKPQLNNEIQLFLYLSPSLNDVEEKLSCICAEFIRISYQDLYDDVLINYKSVQSSTNKRQQMFLEEYRKNLIKPYMDNSNKIRIMAYDKNDIERVETFWRTNLPLFKLAAEVMSKTPDAETAERISSIIQGIDSLGKKYSLYDLWLPNGESYKNERMKVVAKRTVAYLLKNGESISDINNLLPKEIPLICAEEYEQKKKDSSDPRFLKRWDRLEGENLYLFNQWTAARFADLTSRLVTAHHEIKIENANTLSDDGSDI